MNPSAQVQNERQQRIMEYYPLVCIIARRLARRFPGSEEAEFINVGVIGLIDAMDRFDSARGVPFRSYAEIRIRGAIVDSMRAVDWRPRSLRRKATWVSDAEDRFRQDQGRSPLREELAKILDITVGELDEIREATIPQPLISIHTPIHTESEATVGDQVRSPEPDLEALWVDKEFKKEVLDSIRFLPARERVAVTLYYFQGLALKEIGLVLGVTESRACQLRSQGIERLKSYLPGSD